VYVPEKIFYKLHKYIVSRRGRDRTAVGFTITYVQSVPITTKAVSSNSVHGKVYSIPHYVIKFVSDLQQVCGFLRVVQFPPPFKTDSDDITEILLKVALKIMTLTINIVWIWSCIPENNLQLKTT